ncbi:hypothetical protein [Jannaschia ovalis]|uniref:Uncharacterized protein n=1 Tax=Jannaschia ovalis TaxID=3038773 RepID=A0ABY8L791_9RHOB|nr:hypothetical protein [Jannaschia sp. GRR-S6-38]WGH77134.1 hypothetical protein P8627_08650 [Jannaschia sp. GRR-S6-38]
MRLSDIERDQPVFAREGDVNVGAVRAIRNDHVLIHFENFGEAKITVDQIASVHDGKVMLNVAALPPELAQAIGHAHDREEPVHRMPPK